MGNLRARQAGRVCWLESQAHITQEWYLAVMVPAAAIRPAASWVPPAPRALMISLVAGVVWR